jgi:hypothetical protein
MSEEPEKRKITKLQTVTNVLALVHQMRWEKGYTDNKEYMTNWEKLKLDSDLSLTKADLASFARVITETYTRPQGGGAVGVTKAKNASTLKDLVDVVHSVF